MSTNHKPLIPTWGLPVTLGTVFILAIITILIAVSWFTPPPPQQPPAQPEPPTRKFITDSEILKRGLPYNYDPAARRQWDGN